MQSQRERRARLCNPIDFYIRVRAFLKSQQRLNLLFSTYLEYFVAIEKTACVSIIKLQYDLNRTALL